MLWGGCGKTLRCAMCHPGCILLEAAVPSDVNRQVVQWFDGHHRGSPLEEMNELVEETWFRDGVLRNLQAAGAMRSLLGTDYEEPGWLTRFRSAHPLDCRCVVPCCGLQ